MNIHGGGGFDFSECTEEAFHGAVAAHQKHGATTIFPTVLAPEIGVIDKAVAVCEEMMRKKDGPILGLHIEGPYLNPKMAASLFIDKETPATRKSIKRYWNVRIVSSVGIPARRYRVRLSSPNT